MSILKDMSILLASIYSYLSSSPRVRVSLSVNDDLLVKYLHLFIFGNKCLRTLRIVYK